MSELIEMIDNFGSTAESYQKVSGELYKIASEFHNRLKDMAKNSEETLRNLDPLVRDLYEAKSLCGLLDGKLDFRQHESRIVLLERPLLDEIEEIKICQGQKAKLYCAFNQSHDWKDPEHKTYDVEIMGVKQGVGQYAFQRVPDLIYRTDKQAIHDFPLNHLLTMEEEGLYRIEVGNGKEFPSNKLKTADGNIQGLLSYILEHWGCVSDQWASV